MDIYEVAEVDMDGVPSISIQNIQANNFAEAVEIYVRTFGIAQNLPGSKIAVRIPDTPVIMAFDYGVVSG